MENELKKIRAVMSDQNFSLNGKWPLYLLRNEKFPNSNSFEADFRQVEVTDM